MTKDNVFLGICIIVGAVFTMAFTDAMVKYISFEPVFISLLSTLFIGEKGNTIMGMLMIVATGILVIGKTESEDSPLGKSQENLAKVRWAV